MLAGYRYGSDGTLVSADGGASFAPSGFQPGALPSEVARSVGPLAIAPTPPAVAYVALTRVFCAP